MGESINFVVTIWITKGKTAAVSKINKNRDPLSYLYHLLRQFHFVVFELCPKFQVILGLVRQKACSH